MVLFLLLILSLLIGLSVFRTINSIGGDFLCSITGAIVSGQVLLIWLAFALRFVCPSLAAVQIPLTCSLLILFLISLRFFGSPISLKEIYFKKIGFSYRD